MAQTKKRSNVRVRMPPAYRPLLAPKLGEARYRVVYGGRGSAKSWQLARALLIMGVGQQLRILCAREFQTSIADSVHRLLSDQIESLELSGFYSITRTSITGLNGTEFLFKGLRHNVGEIKSTEGIDVCWVEEAEKVSENSWQVLIPTIRKPSSEIWISFNPADEADPTYSRFVKSPPARSIVVKVGYQDNPWLPDVLRQEAEELLKRDPEAYAHVWGGETWKRADAQVLRGKWRVDSFTPAPTWDGPYFGADWGFSQDPTTLVRVWIGDGRLWVEHEVGGVGIPLDEVPELFDTVPGSRTHTIRADSARPETIQYIGSKGFRIQAAPKWGGSVMDGVEWLRKHEEIVIHPRCTRTIEEARLWSYQTDRLTGDPLPKLASGWDHYWDAIRYAVSPLIKSTPQPGFE
jgi:phage terminase large subunit